MRAVVPNKSLDKLNVVIDTIFTNEQIGDRQADSLPDCPTDTQKDRETDRQSRWWDLVLTVKARGREAIRVDCVPKGRAVTTEVRRALSDLW